MANKDNQRIAKNTIFLYFRMLLIMFVNLYASRVTLQVLGVDDYGIYQTVGGVVTFLAFLSNALGSGTSRFITFEMGKEKPRMAELLSTVRIAHIVMALVIVCVGEISGLWAIHHKLVIPADRVEAAVFAFHFSMLATFFQITQVPYNATIIAYEKMNIYAYVSIVEAVGKLAIVYLLNVLLFDKLKVYAVLMCFVTVLVMLLYRIYCRRHYQEIREKLVFNRSIFRYVASFSAWNLLSSSAASLSDQGVTIVINMFFSPAMVTLRSLAMKVNGVINQFVASFRTAVDPQIVKKYASGDYTGSRKLALEAAKFTFYLTMIIVVPFFILTEILLHIWLGVVPSGLVVFVRIVLIENLFESFSASFYAPVYAKGQIKESAIVCPIINALQLPVVYILYKLGAPAVVCAWTNLFVAVVIGFIIRPIFLHTVTQYPWKDILGTIFQCVFVTIFSLIGPICVSGLADSSTIWGVFVIGITCVTSILCVVWLFGIDKEMKSHLIKWMQDRIQKRRNCDI